MTIEKVISERGIREVLHFTTGNGFTGIMATGAVKPRKSLPKEEYLEHIVKYNCADRSRDMSWWGYVNLSLTQVNSRLFNISKDNWHATENCWWCILAFSPEICIHDNVFFTTTNNMYSGVRQKKGKIGLDAMFAPSITQWSNKTICRDKHSHTNQTTCEQAEVLYPSDLSLDYLRRVYVQSHDDAAKAETISSVMNLQIECKVKESWFI